MCSAIIGRSIVYVALQIQNMKLVAFFVSIRFFFLIINIINMKKSKKNQPPFWRNNGAKKSVMPEGKIQLSMPKNPLEDLKWLPELVKSEDESRDIIERLGFHIIEQDAEGFVHVPLFPSQSKRDEDLLQEFINGKWRFMIAACTMRKRYPDKRHETTTRGFDVERVDAALPEIRERLKCRVWKSWDLNENQFFSCEDDDLPAWQFKRIGWSIYPDIPYPEEGGDK